MTWNDIVFQTTYLSSLSHLACFAMKPLPVLGSQACEEKTIKRDGGLFRHAYL